MKRQVRCSLILLATAAIWGFAYVAQKFALGTVGPLTFNTVRGLLAWIVLIPCRAFLDRRNKRAGRQKEYDKRLTLTGGVATGALVCAAAILQAYGLAESEVGKAGFLTTLYIVLVPVFGIFIGKKCGVKTWLCVGIALVGTYFLCVTDGFQIESGDGWLLLCSVFFACNIVVISFICDRVDNVRMSIVEFFVSSAITFVPALVLERPDLSSLIGAMPGIAYSGIFSCGIGYTIEIIGQDGVNPTLASLILSFESVFSLLAGWLFFYEMLSARELFGCLIVVVAVVLAQLQGTQKKRTGAK